ncbi:PREDICTED: aspartic proteinase PCS1-like [Camelina sativa]|uniref:Aspartic proteinase PCS1-like n=1 Tax=Camelina sativa TaxID=90675 RepID=A0ABM0UGM8_CAMSA|nr:PREDICTED: aspartic proteinase PCS1-like [Camelina sativa]
MSHISKPLFFTLTLFIFFLCNSVYLTWSSSLSLHFPLTSLRLTPTTTNSSSFKTALLSRRNPSRSSSSPPYTFRSNVKYSMALVLSLPIGTPSQSQELVLDTGSQLSWIQCHPKKIKKPPTTSFDPSLSSSFSDLPCSHPLCKPRIPDFTLPTSCDSNRLCHYSYFYADGTFAEGNLVKEKFTFSNSQITPPLILGCAKESTDEKGILGMNLGRLSFISQAKISKFSYCIPIRSDRPGLGSTGSFYLGNNPNSRGFKYVSLLTFPQSQRMPNLDPLAYTVPLLGIRIGQKRLNIPASAFRPDAGGSGQTMVDSGSEFTHLVDVAYDKVKEEIVRHVGSRLKKGYVYGSTADMCFDENIGRLIGDLVFEFGRGVEILVEKQRLLVNVGGGVHCLGIGRSSMLGAASNIIGNVHQQNLWVEFDVTNRRVGFSKADCSRLSP